MVQTLPVTNTKSSKFGDNYEQVLFPNGEWYDVEKKKYIWAKLNNNSNWFLINKDSEFLKD